MALRSRFYIGILVLVLVCLAGLSFLYFNRQKDDSIVDGSPLREDEVSAQFQVTYQRPNDSEGRTIIYEYFYGWSGVGRQIKYPWNYIVGVFNGWEEIPGSSDRYILLANPHTNEQLEKIRVVYSERNAFNSYSLETTLAYEDLEVLQNGGREIVMIGKVSKTSEEELNNWFQPGDVVLAFLTSRYFTSNAEEDFGVELKDQAGNAMAHILTVRRNKAI
jgi:hypothetical protein